MFSAGCIIVDPYRSKTGNFCRQLPGTESPKPSDLCIRIRRNVIAELDRCLPNSVESLQFFFFFFFGH